MSDFRVGDVVKIHPDWKFNSEDEKKFSKDKEYIVTALYNKPGYVPRMYIDGLPDGKVVICDAFYLVRRKKIGMFTLDETGI